MKVGDIMTRDAITIPGDTPVMAIARLLSERHISAVPITDSWGMLLGIVSEADLIRRLAVSDRQEPGLLRALFYDRDRAARHYAAVHGATAADIMTRDPVTVAEGTTVEHAAALLESHGIKRLPVVHDGTLVGILSRTDLLRALLVPPADTSDAAIAAALREEIARLPWADTPFVFLEVRDGAVTFYGFCHSPAVRLGLVALAKDMPGVREVADRITQASRAGVA
jgi:CBS domain-containing protein